MPANFSAKVLFRLFLVALVASSVTTRTPDCAAAQEESEQDELFTFPPQSPERLVRGAILADKLDRPQLAQKYLQTILDNQPSPETLRRLRREIGLSTFLKLSATPRLQPQSQKVLALVNAASPYETLSQAAIENLVQSLGQSPAITTDASLKLLTAEEEAVAALLNADPATRPGKIAHELLSRYPNRFQSGLQNALVDATPETQVRILKHLTRTGDKDLAIEILTFQFSSNSQVAAAARSSLRNLEADQWVSLSASEAATELLNHAAESLQRANHLAENNRTVIGTQQDSEQNVQPPVVNPTDMQASSQLQHALKLTTDAATLDDSLQTKAMQLSVEAAMNAWPAQWPDTAASAESVDSVILSQALHVSHQTKNTAGLLSLLNTQNANEVLQADSRMSRELLLYRDPRVRLLTAASVWKTSNAPSAVESVLHDIADGGRKPEAVVIDPRYPEGSKATGILREIGYDVTFARSGSEGFTAAAEQLHCELVLIHSNSIRWPLSITLANLRADFRTQNVPIIIVGPSEHAQSVVRIVAADDLIWFEAEPLSKEILERSLQLKKVPGAILSESERVAMQQLARDLMRQE